MHILKKIAKHLIVNYCYGCTVRNSNNCFLQYKKNFILSNYYRIRSKLCESQRRREN